MFVRPGFGCACDPNDAGSIAAAVWPLMADRMRMREMGDAGRLQILRKWNYEAMFAPVLKLISATTII